MTVGCGTGTLGSKASAAVATGVKEGNGGGGGNGGNENAARTHVVGVVSQRTGPLDVPSVRATLICTENAPSASGVPKSPMELPQSENDVTGARHSLSATPKFCCVEGAKPDPDTVTSWPGVRLVDGVTVSVGVPTLGMLGAPSLCSPPLRVTPLEPPETAPLPRAGVDGASVGVRPPGTNGVEVIGDVAGTGELVVGVGLGAPSLPIPEAPAAPDIVSATTAATPIRAPLMLRHLRANPTPCHGNLRIPTSPSTTAP